MVDDTKTRIFHVCEILFQQILAVFVLLILWELIESYSFSDKGTWHIILCVFGFALCIAEGVQIYRKESIVFVGKTRLDRVMAHGIVMITGFVSVTIGISLKISQSDLNLNHFTSTHGKLGLSAWIIAFIAGVGGVVSAKFSNTGREATIKLVHLLVGVTAYLLGIITLGYGLKYLRVGENGRIFLIVLLSIYVCYSLLGPCQSVLGRLRK